MILHKDGFALKGRVIYATRSENPFDIAIIVGVQVSAIKPCRISDRVPPVGTQKNIELLLLITHNYNCMSFYRS